MNNKAHLRPKDYDSNGDIFPMACKEEKGDLISRNALIQHTYSAVVDGVEKDIIDLSDVDNALTVELTETEVQEVLNKRCMTAVANEYLIALHNNQARPKGEWLEPYESKIAQECSICHRQMPAPEWFHFCPNCGADMRKEGAI